MEIVLPTFWWSQHLLYHEFHVLTQDKLIFSWASILTLLCLRLRKCVHPS